MNVQVSEDYDIELARGEQAFIRRLFGGLVRLWRIERPGKRRLRHRMEKH